jgi:hypothetical protein
MAVERYIQQRFHLGHRVLIVVESCVSDVTPKDKEELMAVDRYMIDPPGTQDSSLFSREI